MHVETDPPKLELISRLFNPNFLLLQASVRCSSVNSQLLTVQGSTVRLLLCCVHSIDTI